MVSKITNYIIERFQSDDLVNTITFSDTSLIDTERENIYPLVSIRLNDINPTDDLLLYDYTISVLQQRELNRRLITSKLMDDTNYLDNLNECESICLNFINHIRRIEDNNINVDSISVLDEISNLTINSLDGFRFTIVLSYPNTGFCG